MRTAGWPSIVVAVALFNAHTGKAEPLRLTADEAVAHALSANLELRANRKDLDVATANLHRSKAWLPANPYLSGGSQHTSQAGLGPNYVFLLSQEFEVGGQRGKRVGAATENVEKVTYDVKSAQQNLAADVRKSFVQALVNADRLTLAHKALDATADLSRQLEHGNASSDTEHMDLNIAKIQESRAGRDLAAAEQAREITFATLRRLLMLPLEQEIELQGSPQHEVRDLPPGPELVDRALRQRADLAALRHDVQRADLQLALAKREAIPNLTLSGTVSRFEGDTLVGGDVGLPIPIFHHKSGEIEEAIAERDRSSLQLQNLERTAAQEALDARRACVIAAGNLKSLQDDIVPKNEENLRLERRLYEREDVTVSELVGVQADVFGAYRDQLDALQAYNEALIELERVIGGSLDAR